MSKIAYRLIKNTNQYIQSHFIPGIGNWVWECPDNVVIKLFQNEAGKVYNAFVIVSMTNIFYLESILSRIYIVSTEYATTPKMKSSSRGQQSPCIGLNDLGSNQPT